MKIYSLAKSKKYKIMRHTNVIKDLLHLNRHHISPDMDKAIDMLCKFIMEKLMSTLTIKNYHGVFHQGIRL